MSTTVELVRANERYARLRAAVEGLAAEWDSPDYIFGEEYAAQVRALLRCSAEDRAHADWNSSWIPCQLSTDHSGPHYATSGCAGGSRTWADA